MLRRTPRSTRTDTLFPYTTLFRSLAYVDLVDGTVTEASLVPSEVEGRVSTALDTNGEKQQVGGNLKGAAIPENRIVFSEKFACPVSGFTIAEIEPRLFSFNAPQGACPACDGRGEQRSAERRVGKECGGTCRCRW